MTETNTAPAGVAGDRLRQFVDKIERLEVTKAETQAEIKDVYNEAKGEGFNVKVLRILIGLRKLRPNDRQEQEELVDLYKSTLGMM